MLFKGRKPTKPQLKKKPSQQKAAHEDREAPSDDDTSEYRDLVFDMNESKALVQMADDFLTGQPSLALTQGEDDIETQS